MTSEDQILVREAGAQGPWVSPEIRAYDNEAHLQALLVADPSRGPAVGAGAIAVAELPTGGGPVDVCIVDLDGSVTVVECKLATNSERRRMVIGQVIDYAAAIWLEGDASFLAAWQRCKGPDLEQTLTASAFSQLKVNIARGHIHLCLAVDAIDADLRRLIEYLNKVTRDEVHVTALQLAYARHGPLEILIPSTFGGEIVAVKTRASAGGKEPWTRQAFLDAIRSDTDRQLASELFGRLEALSERYGDHELVWYGSRPGGGVHLHPYRLRFAPVQLWVNTAGRLMLYGNWALYTAITGHEGFAGLAALLGQDHKGGAKGVPVDSLNLDRLWDTVVQAALAINVTAPS